LSPSTRESISLIADVLGIVAFVCMVVQGVAWLLKKKWLPDIASMFVPSGPITLGIAQPVSNKTRAQVHVQTHNHKVATAYFLRKLHEELTKCFRQSLDLAVFTHSDADPALGAVPHSVYRLVLGEAAWLVVIGAALGTTGAVVAATVLRHLLFAVEPWDLPTMIATAALLTASVLFASFLPARRAANVNPIDVLRAE
jgi:hypothetical protein